MGRVVSDDNVIFRLSLCRSVPEIFAVTLESKVVKNRADF